MTDNMKQHIVTLETELKKLSDLRSAARVVTTVLALNQTLEHTPAAERRETLERQIKNYFSGLVAIDHSSASQEELDRARYCLGLQGRVISSLYKEGGIAPALTSAMQGFQSEIDALEAYIPEQKGFLKVPEDMRARLFTDALKQKYEERSVSPAASAPSMMSARFLSKAR